MKFGTDNRYMILHVLYMYIHTGPIMLDVQQIVSVASNMHIYT